MLQYHAGLRPTIIELMDHPWVNSKVITQDEIDQELYSGQLTLQESTDEFDFEEY